MNIGNTKGEVSSNKYAIRRIKQVFGVTGEIDLKCIEDDAFKNICKTMYVYDPETRSTASELVEDMYIL